MPEITWRQILPNCNRIQYFSKIWWTISRSYIYIYIYKTRLFIKPISLYICTFLFISRNSPPPKYRRKSSTLRFTRNSVTSSVFCQKVFSVEFFKKKFKWYDGSPLSVGRITKIGSKYTTTLASLRFHGEKCFSPFNIEKKINPLCKPSKSIQLTMCGLGFRNKQKGI